MTRLYLEDDAAGERHKRRMNMEERNKYGLYDYAQKLSEEDITRPQSPELLKEQMELGGAFLMEEKEAVELGLINEEPDTSSEFLLGEMTLSAADAAAFGITN